ncbi:hypothetical protein AAE478_006571 [Parahypoxylon ruwenzoriense]
MSVDSDLVMGGTAGYRDAIRHKEKEIKAANGFIEYAGKALEETTHWGAVMQRDHLSGGQPIKWGEPFIKHLANSLEESDIAVKAAADRVDKVKKVDHYHLPVGTIQHLGPPFEFLDETSAEMSNKMAQYETELEKWRAVLKRLQPEVENRAKKQDGRSKNGALGSKGVLGSQQKHDWYNEKAEDDNIDDEDLDLIPALSENEYLVATDAEETEEEDWDQLEDNKPEDYDTDLPEPMRTTRAKMFKEVRKNVREYFGVAKDEALPEVAKKANKELFEELSKAINLEIKETGKLSGRYKLFFNTPGFKNAAGKRSRHRRGRKLERQSKKSVMERKPEARKSGVGRKSATRVNKSYSSKAGKTRVTSGKIKTAVPSTLRPRPDGLFGSSLANPSSLFKNTRTPDPKLVPQPGGRGPFGTPSPARRSNIARLSSADINKKGIAEAHKLAPSLGLKVPRPDSEIPGYNAFHKLINKLASVNRIRKDDDSETSGSEAALPVPARKSPENVAANAAQTPAQSELDRPYPMVRVGNGWGILMPPKRPITFGPPQLPPSPDPINPSQGGGKKR